jgi:hypothetical protein
MAIIVPITSTFDANGVTRAERAFKNLGGQAGVLGKSVSSSSNLMKSALAGVGAASVVKGLQSAVMAASNLSESIAKTNTVFGKNAKEIQDWSQTTARALGVSQQAALEAAGTYGNLFRAFGINEQESAKMSQSLVTLAADLASFNNVPIDDALLALRSGLSGETEPLKRFGIALNETRLKEEALAMGLIKTSKGTLPQLIKTQAAYSLIMKDSALAQGDVARTAGGLANQLKFLQAGLQDAKAGFGEALLPIVLNVVTAFNDKLLPAIERVVKAIKLEGAGGGLKTVATEISNVLYNLDGVGKTIKNVITLFIGIKVVIPIVLALRASWIAVSVSIGAAATATQIAAGVMKSALASTGIGLLIVGLGLVVQKLIDSRIAAQTLDKEVFFVVSNGKTQWNRYGNSIYQGTTVQLNAAQLAATRLSDAIDMANVKLVKIRIQQGKATYNPVTNPAGTVTGGGGGGTGGLTKAQKAAEAAAKAAEAAAKAAAKATEAAAKAAAKAAEAAAKAAAKAAEAAAKAMAALVAKSSAAATKALDKMNTALTTAREKLQAAREAYADYKNSVKDAIISQFSFTSALNGFTDTQKNAKDAAEKLAEAQLKYDDALKDPKDVEKIADALKGLTAAQEENAKATANKKTFLQVMREQAAAAVSFASKVQTLISMGLSKSGIDQVVAAGAEAGTAIADELIAGGTGAIQETNSLLNSVRGAATALGTDAANAFYQAGVTNGQALVNGVINAVTAAGFRMVGGAVALPAKLQAAINKGKLTPAQVTELNSLLAGVPKLAAGGIVNKPTLAMIGEAGPEAVIPLSGRNAGMGNTINLTVNAGMGADGNQIGREIVDIIKRYERVSGPVFASA